MKYNLTLKRPSDETTAVVLITFINQRRFKTGLGITVPTKAWDKANQRIKTGTSKNLIVLQSELDAAVGLIVNLHNQLVVMDDVELSVETMREGVKRLKAGKDGVTAKAVSFHQWVDEFMEEIKAGKRFTTDGTALKEGTIKRYRVVHGLLGEFKAQKRGGKAIAFEDVDSKFLADWKRWRADDITVGNRVLRKGVTVNTLKNDIKILKVWLTESYHRGFHTNRIWERNEMRMRATPSVRVHLTPDELEKLEAATFESLRKGNQGPQSSAHNNIRDMFIMACWTGGRISDVKRFPDIMLNAWNENGGKCPEEITFIQSKTNRPVTVPILPMARRIIEKHNGALPSLPNEQKVNAYLKQVVRVAGINRTIELADNTVDRAGSTVAKVHELVTFHSGRRTFATNVYNLGVLSLGELQSLTGHESERALMTYLNVTQTEVSQRAAARLQEALRLKE